MRGLTQEELAKKINKTRALVSYAEQTGKINHYTLQTILKALGVSEEEFEGFKGKIGMVQEELGADQYGNKELSHLKHNLEHCQKENEALKELVASQKKIIGMLEKQKA